jgi:hypothetical protein
LKKEKEIMAKTVIGLFDDYSEAQRTEKELQSSGFGRSEVTITRESDSPTAMELMTEARVPAEDIRVYTEGVRQGGTLLVQTEDRNTGRAADILSNYNMVDVDARLAEYRQSGMSDMRSARSIRTAR